MKPVHIKVIEKKKLFFKWDDGSKFDIPLEKLRGSCPCATCLAERERRGNSYIQIFNDNQVRIANIVEVGSYAIGITWKDGHNTGIYEFAFLKKLAES